MTTSVPTTMPPDDFMLWLDPYGLSKISPYQYKVVDIWRKGWTKVETIDPHAMHPQMNVAGLYWRPVM